MKTEGLVVLGASLGGIEAICAILSSLPESFPAAIVMIQHRAPTPDSRLGPLLARRSALPVVEPNDRDKILGKKAYLGPADYHLLVDGDRFYFSVDPPEHHARPSIDVLFESAADSKLRPLVGVLLTAASQDGAVGLERIARSGCSTIVQDPTEAVSPVAIEAAISRYSLHQVLPLRQVASRLVEIFDPDRRSLGRAGRNTATDPETLHE